MCTEPITRYDVELPAVTSSDTLWSVSMLTTMIHSSLNASIAALFLSYRKIYFVCSWIAAKSLYVMLQHHDLKLKGLVQLHGLNGAIALLHIIMNPITTRLKFIHLYMYTYVMMLLHFISKLITTATVKYSSMVHDLIVNDVHYLFRSITLGLFIILFLYMSRTLFKMYHMRQYTLSELQEQPFVNGTGHVIYGSGQHVNTDKRITELDQQLNLEVVDLKQRFLEYCSEHHGQVWMVFNGTN